MSISGRGVFRCPKVWQGNSSASEIRIKIEKNLKSYGNEAQGGSRDFLFGHE